MSDNAAESHMAPSNGRERLVIDHARAVDIVERLRETHVDITGHAFLLRLDTLIVRLGVKWDAKRDLVFDHLKTGFERHYPEPNWCIAIGEDAWMGLLPALGTRRGALFMAQIWRDVCNFFVGDMSSLGVPLYDVLVEDVDCFSIRQIDLRTVMDVAEDEDVPLKAHAGHFRTEEGRAPSGAPQATPIQRPVMVAASVAYAGRKLKVASSLEPLFEMKKMAMIGHRLEALVMDEGDNTLLDRRSLANLDWGLHEMADVVNIDQGLRLLRLRSAEQRKMVMLVPAAFSTFASARARKKITTDVAQAATELGLKVLFEVRGLDGVPPHRILEIVSLIKPFCMTVVGSVTSDRKAIGALNKCGLSGVSLEYDGVKRDEESLRDYLTVLSLASRASAGACMMHGFDNYRQMAVARLAGVTHASVKTAALLSPRTSADNPEAQVGLSG